MGEGYRGWRGRHFSDLRLLIDKTSGEFLHILPGEVLLLTRDWADLRPEEVVLVYLGLQTLQGKGPAYLLVKTLSNVCWEREHKKHALFTLSL